MYICITYNMFLYKQFLQHTCITEMMALRVTNIFVFVYICCNSATVELEAHAMLHVSYGYC